MGDGIFNVFLKGLQGKTTTLCMKKDASVDDLFKEVNSKTGIPLDEIRLLFAAHELRMGHGKTLVDYHIQHGSTVFMVLRLRGGWNPQEMMRIKKKSLLPLPPFIKLTTSQPDMISFDDDHNVPRAVMPCGHVIGPSSMTSYCQSLLSSGHFQFKCPYVDEKTGKTCDTQWEYFLVRHVACLSPDEQQEFETRISENYLQKGAGIRQYPGCQTYCNCQDKDNPRVLCPVCAKGKAKGYEFCWNCLHEWTGGSVCANVECGGQDQRLKHLAQCSKKTIVQVEGCPSVRACPSCGILIEHVSNCKQMSCRACKTQFCFICLKVPNKGQWQCGSYNSPCTPAPLQTILPGSN